MWGIEVILKEHLALFYVNKHGISQEHIYSSLAIRRVAFKPTSNLQNTIEHSFHTLLKYKQISFILDFPYFLTQMFVL